MTVLVDRSSLLLGLLFVLLEPARCHTDFESRLGSCSAPLPQAFTCRTIPEWGGFLKRMIASAKDGFPLDTGLFQMAQDILARTQDKPYPPQDFYKYLCGGPESEWPLPDGFCLFGFVGALFVRGRHLMHSDDEEFRKSAEMDFQYATTVLGKEGSVDFLDSSPWPLSILDVYININETEFMTYEQYDLVNPVRPPVVPLEELHWRPPPASAALRNRKIPAEVQLAVMGTHATLSLEPVDMLRRFAQDVKWKASFYGLEPRWCQILGVCDDGSSAISQLFKDAEKDPYAYPWERMVDAIRKFYEGDANLRGAELLLCTEPLAGCLMLKQVAEANGRRLPLLGYLGVALLNSCPPDDVDIFWEHFAALKEGDSPGRPSSVLAVNNLILSEQIFYQSGWRMPYVRAQGLYTGMSYTPLKANEVLVWRAPLFMYTTSRCAVGRLLQGMPKYPLNFHFVEEEESIPYREVVQYKVVVLLPWDHALMTFYELYSAGMPMLLPAKEWMYRFLYQRGQLSVGERMYQSIMPGHTPPHAEFAEDEVFKEKAGPPDPRVGMSSAKAARGVAEDMLTRGMQATDLDTSRQYMKAALELVQDMRYFLAVAENRTDEDSYTSMGVVRRSRSSKADAAKPAAEQPRPAAQRPPGGQSSESSSAKSTPWHPYTPFQMSTRDSNDWTRMRKGGWWLRRGVRFDAMRYWYQFSDFARFPGLRYFGNLPEMLCLAESLDVREASERMRRYNEQTLVHSATFWASAVVELLGSSPTAE